MQYDYLIKLLLIGDSGVGKSSLLARFTDDKFAPDVAKTIGMDFRVKMIEVGRRRVKLQVWDTAGQERFHSITQQYYRNAMGIILVYDVTCEESLANVRQWAVQIATHCSEGISQLLVGNKADCDMHSRAVDAARGQALAEELGMPFIEASARSGRNVEEAFELLADAVRRRLQSKEPAEFAAPAPGGASAGAAEKVGPASVALQRTGCCAGG